MGNSLCLKTAQTPQRIVGTLTYIMATIISEHLSVSLHLWQRGFSPGEQEAAHLKTRYSWDTKK